MEKGGLLGVLLTGLIALPLTAPAEIKLKMSENSELELGFSIQTLARFTDFQNPNSDDADSGVDFFLRRGRVRLGGNATDYLRFFSQAEASAATDNDASVRVSDAWVNVHYKELAQLIVGLQKPPTYRSILTSDDAMLGIDRPGITGYNLTWGLRGRVEFDTTTLRNSNSGIWGPYKDRDLGATLFGAYSLSDMLHFKYYVGLYEGIQRSTANNEKPRFAFRVQVNLFDSEPHYDNLGTYLGTKKTISLGYSNDLQHDVVTNLKNGNGVNYSSYNEFDLFIEYPVGPGSATFEGSYLHTCMVGGSGPVQPGIPDHPVNATEGKGLYFQGGYYFPDWKVQPWAGYERWLATDPLGRWSAYRFGVSYFLKEQNANIKLGYERVDTTEKDIGSSKTTNSGKDNINTLVLGVNFTF
jgi:hypothetical protein